MPGSQLLDSLPILAVFGVFALISMLCYEAGFRLGWVPNLQEGHFIYLQVLRDHGGSAALTRWNRRLQRPEELDSGASQPRSADSSRVSCCDARFQLPRVLLQSVDLQPLIQRAHR